MTPDTLNSLSQRASDAFKAPTARSTPFSIRFSEEERAALTARAGGVALGAYIKAQLFDAESPRRRPTRPVADPTALARALALLGQSRIASNLNQLAKAANMGTLPVDTDVEADLVEACAYISEVRALLIEAVGLKSGHRS